MLRLEVSLYLSAIVAQLRATVSDMTRSSPSSPPSSRGDKSPSATTPPTTQRPRMGQSSPPTSPKPRARRARRPAKGSLFDLLRQHAGKPLFVRPICWTDLHARLLGAQFHELPPCDTPLPCNMPGSPPTLGHMRPSRTITALSHALTEILLPSASHPALSSSAVKTTLMTLWPAAFGKPQLLPELNIFVGSNVYRDAVRVQAMWNFPSETSGCSSQASYKTVSTRLTDSNGLFSSSPGAHNPANLPMLCYIGKNQLASIRRNLYRVPSDPGKRLNAPVSRLQQLRAKLLVPADPDQDAHFVSMFLAMAQRHFYPAPASSLLQQEKESQWSPRKGKPPRPDFQNLKLRILTQDNDTSEFLLYTGYVTASFLGWFYDPSSSPGSDDDTKVPGIKIELTRVPIWPILGLRERLGKALGEDVVGQFDTNNMETWEDGVEPKRSSSKRKREALPRAFNGSLDEKSDDEEPQHGEKKRCLAEGTRVGVVV